METGLRWWRFFSLVYVSIYENWYVASVGDQLILKPVKKQKCHTFSRQLNVLEKYTAQYPGVKNHVCNGNHASGFFYIPAGCHMINCAIRDNCNTKPRTLSLSKCPSILHACYRMLALDNTLEISIQHFTHSPSYKTHNSYKYSTRTYWLSMHCNIIYPSAPLY